MDESPKMAPMEAPSEKATECHSIVIETHDEGYAFFRESHRLVMERLAKQEEMLTMLVAQTLEPYRLPPNYLRRSASDASHITPGLDEGYKGHTPRLDSDAADGHMPLEGPPATGAPSAGGKEAYQKPIGESGPAWSRWAYRIAAHLYFEVFFGTVIILNGIIIGAEVHHQSTQYTEASTPLLMALSTLCSILFLVELVMRMMALRSRFFCATNTAWNYFDFFIVVSWGVEVVVELAKASASGGDMGDLTSVAHFRLVRIIRVTRLVRLLRIARIVRVVKALRILVHSILSTLKSVMWAMFLLFIIIYFFAIMFTQATNSTLIEINGCRSEDCIDSAPHLWSLWGTIPRSMYTLFMTITNGIDWSEAARPMDFVGGEWVLILMLFIIFCTIAVLNVVTGVFCQSAIVSAQRDRELVIQNLLENKETHVKNIKNQFYKMFENMDQDASGTISVEEFEHHINDEKVSGFFVLLDIDASDAFSLFRLLDEDGSGAIDAEEFVDGCLRLQGSARSIDLAKIRHENKYMLNCLSQKINTNDKNLRGFMEHTQGALRTIHRHVGLVGDRTQLVVEHAVVPPAPPLCDSNEFLQPKTPRLESPLSAVGGAPVNEST
eukprot:TRINITY_DN8915_c0_g1_i1.p1 TRINITY_DN8915_c0_g1~~TRINITY_DN8915_c0_g1_i1.p1  ORF type:complete len:609 (+),score=101.45 TRINITY_DN8915_c0_g1_i1:69-1895(+)